MAEFKGLGIVDLKEVKHENSEIKTKLKPKLSWSIGNEFKAQIEGFTTDLNDLRAIQW